jgi:hypothetical protein
MGESGTCLLGKYCSSTHRELNPLFSKVVETLSGTQCLALCEIGADVPARAVDDRLIPDYEVLLVQDSKFVHRVLGT